MTDVYFYIYIYSSLVRMLSGKEFHTAGAAYVKALVPSVLVLVIGGFSLVFCLISVPCSFPELPRIEKMLQCKSFEASVHQRFNFKLYPLCHWQPTKSFEERLHMAMFASSMRWNAHGLRDSNLIQLH